MLASATCALCAAQSDLWARLVALDLDGQATFSFSKRLARDNGWSLAFAQRVVLEYKKFVYLAATCGHPVTPSDEVDQAWHLHLVYTRLYWDDLCGRVLGFALHHGPTKGGAAEGHKFQDWYAATRQSYQAAFEEAPPADIWPSAAVRFGEAPHFRRVNMRSNWLLPKPRLPKWQRPRLPAHRLVGFGLLGLLMLAGCTTRTPLNPFNWYGPEFLGLFWGLCCTLLPLACWLRYRGQGMKEMHEGPPPSTYALARLAEHGRRVADSALAALYFSGHVVFTSSGLVKRTTNPAPTDAYERSIWNRLAVGGSPLADAQQWGLSGSNPTLAALDNELEVAGLLLPRSERRRLDKLPLLTALALGLFGIIKVLVGVNRDRPVGFLLLSLLGLGIATFLTQFYGSWASGRGTYVLEGIAHSLARQRGRANEPTVVILAVAVLGVSSLHSLGLSQLATYLAPVSSGSDSNSGCGGSGCGSGGCGGCGGCGS
jgi:uncharacterized protein (TIGR04222 family)